MPDPGAARGGVRSAAQVDRAADAGWRAPGRARRVRRDRPRPVADERRPDRPGERVHPRAGAPQTMRAVSGRKMRICVVGAGADTMVVPAINGLPWWYFFKEGGRLDGRPIDCLDPGGELLAALDPGHILGCVVHASAEVTEPGVVSHNAGGTFIIGEPDRTKSARAGRLAAAMNAAGFEARVAEDIL